MSQANTNRLIISGCVLKRTCYACPEQYDVYFGDFQLGYLRLRHGTFTASLYNYDGPTVYHGYPKGDGIFETDERIFFLTEACDSLLAAHNAAVIEKADIVYD